MEPLQVVLFGGFQLRYGSGTVPPMPSRAARSLFAYLVVDPGTTHPRERIAAEFWPDLPPARARRRLSHTLWQVQDALGELVGDVPYLQVTTDSIGFDHDLPFWVDVAEFERGLDRARSARADGDLDPDRLRDLERTVELYRGEFLAGHYEEWIAPEQERLHQRYLEALAWLVVGKKQQGAFEDALVYARRLTNEDPLREDGHREVMRLYVLLGRTSDAIRQYERCAEVLSAELGTVPSPATHQLYERIVRRRPSSPVAREEATPPFPDRLPLVGRGRERETSIDVLERALSGRGGAVLVEGEPGLGKSRLLAEAVDDAHWRSFVTLQASCHGPEPMPPYATVQDLLESVLSPLRVEQLRPRVDEIWLAEAARLVPSLGRALPAGSYAAAPLRHGEGAQRLRDALVHVLLGLAALDPTAIVVDDLQWADTESLDVLVSLASEVVDHRIALLVGYRGDDARERTQVWTAIRELDRRMQPDRLLLGPFDLTATSEVARALARGRTFAPSAVEQLHRETGGNPLFLLETLRTLTDQDRLSLLEADDGAELPLPSSIRAIVSARLEPLPREIREILDLAAVVGEGVDLDLLTDATELPREVVVDAAAQLVRGGLLTQDGDTLELRHHQVRRAALDELAEGRARALHLRVGRSLERMHPGAVERLAHHFLEAGRHREAVRYLVAAAENAVEVHAYTAADEYLRRAVDQQTRGPVTLGARFELLARRESVLDVLGDRAAQDRMLSEMALLASEPHHLAEVARRRTLLLAHRGDLEEALDAGERAVDHASELDDAASAAALVALGTASLFAGRNERAAEALREAAEIVGVAREEADVRTTLASVLFRLQRYEEAEQELARATQLADDAGAAREETRALGLLGAIRGETGAWAAAAELHERAIERCREIGFRYGEAVNLVNLAGAYFNVRRPVAALEAFEAADVLFARLDDARGTAMVQMNRGFVQHALLGRDAEARTDLAAAAAYFASVHDHAMVAQCDAGLVAIALRAGDIAEASRLLEHGAAAVRAAEDAWADAHILHRRAELEHRAGNHADALAHVLQALELAEGHGFHTLSGRLRGLEGELLLALDRTDEAVAATEAAVAFLDRGDGLSYLVRFQRYLALVAAGQEDAAESELAAARSELAQAFHDLEPADRDVAAQVPEHARILAGRVALSVRVLTVAAQSAPAGRALRAAELVDVTVDLSAGRDQPDDPVEGRRWLLQHVVEQIQAQGGAPTVGDLAGVLEVSPATVRRDLAAMRERGTTVVTRGHRAG